MTLGKWFQSMFDKFRPLSSRRQPSSTSSRKKEDSGPLKQEEPKNFPKTRAKWKNRNTYCLGDCMELLTDIVSEAESKGE